MKEKTANLLADAFEKTFEAVGLSATELAGIILGMNIPAAYKKFVRMGFKAPFKHYFMRQREPSKRQLTQVLAMVEGLRIAPHKMRSLMKQTLKTLPRARGGPPRKVSPEEEKLVCAEIVALRSQYDTREAIRQVARKRGASERTIYRIWGKYYPKKRKLSTPSS